MKTPLTPLPGSVTAPRGFRAAGVFCDIKRLGTGKGSNKGKKRDLALIVSDVPATAAGMFTTNQACAAPVKVCLEQLKRGRAQAVVVNSGNANACTGKQGLQDAREMARFTEATLALPPGAALVGSTGRIGVAMPMDHVRAGIIEAALGLGTTAAHAAQAAEAILTSDTHAKQVAVQFKLGGRTVRLGGICKGAGMIQPGMSATGRRPAATPRHATMLCFLTTDAAVEAQALQAALREAVAHSFNRITVDGDMSTNDTVLVLANGRAGNRPLGVSAPGFPQFQAALSHACLALARMIVRDTPSPSRTIIRASARQPPDSLEPPARPAHGGHLQGALRGGGAAGIRSPCQPEYRTGPGGHLRRRPDGGVCGLQQGRRERSQLAGRLTPAIPGADKPPAVPAAGLCDGSRRRVPASPARKNAPGLPPAKFLTRGRVPDRVRA